MTLKKRKYGDLSASQPANDGNDDTLLNDVFAAFTGKRPQVEAEAGGPASQAETEAAPAAQIADDPSSQPPRSSQLRQSSQLREHPAAGYDSSQLPQSSQLRAGSQPPQSGQVTSIEPLNLIASLPEVRGHTEVPHQVTDHLYRHLDVYEQAAYTQLYRLSWGFGSKTCFISNPRLAERSNMSEAQVKKIVSRLAGKGLVRKTGNVQGFGKNQGVEYEVSAPSWQLQRSSQPPQSRQPRDGSQPPQSPYKEEYKEIDKGEVSKCPDCLGSGFWYPAGTDKGVRPGCTHPRLLLTGT